MDSRRFSNFFNIFECFHNALKPLSVSWGMCSPS